MGYNDTQFNRNFQLNDTGFNRAFAQNQASFDQTNARAQQRFANAMSLFGAGQQNQQGSIQNALGLLQGSQGLDQNLLQAIGLGGTLGAQKSGVNQAAYGPGLDATVAKNNTSGAALGTLLGGLQDSGILDQLKGWYGDQFGQIGEVKPSVGKINTPSAPPNPNSAGGEAAPTGQKAGGLITKTGGGITDTSGQGLLNTAGNAASIYTGVKEGGVAGYGKAAGAAANMAGYDVPGLGYIDAVDKLAKGDAGGAGLSAMITAAGPVAALMNAVAGFANQKKDKRDAALDAWQPQLIKNRGRQQVSPRHNIYKFPDGRYIQLSGPAVKNVAQALVDKDEGAYAKAMEELMTKNIKTDEQAAAIKKMFGG